VLRVTVYSSWDPWDPFAFAGIRKWFPSRRNFHSRRLVKRTMYISSCVLSLIFKNISILNFTSVVCAAGYGIFACAIVDCTIELRKNIRKRLIWSIDWSSQPSHCHRVLWNLENHWLLLVPFRSTPWALLERLRTLNLSIFRKSCSALDGTNILYYIS
jgi:hypothetical protein